VLVPAVEPFTLVPIATVVGGRVDAQDDEWLGVEADVVLDERFPVDSLRGLDAFSHVDVVYVFHLVGDDDITTGARHPRGRQDLPAVGIFAQRARMRPNRIGVGTCELLGIEGRTLHVRGLDAVDSTPVLDIKPTMASMRPPGHVREPAWVQEIMRSYW